jgi:hypothetical protein
MRLPSTSPLRCTTKRPTRSAWLALGLTLIACGSDGGAAGDDEVAVSAAGASSGGLDADSGGASSGTSASGARAGSGGTGATSGGARSGGSPGVGGTTASTGSRSGDEAVGTGGSPPAISSCDPLDMDGWEAPAYVPARHAAVCSEAEIARYFDACLSGADCSAFQEGGASAECGACLAPSRPSEDAWGPVLLTRPPPFYVYDSNAGGCIELLGEPECGAKIQAADECARQACDAPCTVDGELVFAAYQTCTQHARQTVCADRQAEAVCILDPDHATACNGEGGFAGLFAALAQVFCGEE